MTTKDREVSALCDLAMDDPAKANRWLSKNGFVSLTHLSGHLEDVDRFLMHMTGDPARRDGMTH